MTHWVFHPAVRTGMQLTPGERAADRLKATFGSWLFLILLNGFIAAWIIGNLIGHPFDPYPFILLNLGLSWLAAQQGGALQIAANRGDRIASELARHTFENGEIDRKNGEKLMEMNKQQLEILRKIDRLQAAVTELSDNEGTLP